MDRATINLENGKTFTIVAHNQSKNNKYIKSVKLNGETYNYSFLKHDTIINGGVLEFTMSNKISIWGTTIHLFLKLQ